MCARLTYSDPKMGPQLGARQRTLAMVVLPGLREW